MFPFQTQQMFSLQMVQGKMENGSSLGTWSCYPLFYHIGHGYVGDINMDVDIDIDVQGDAVVEI